MKSKAVQGTSSWISIVTEFKRVHFIIIIIFLYPELGIISHQNYTNFAQDP